MAYGSGPTVHLYPDARSTSRRPAKRSSNAPLLLGLGVPLVLLGLGGLLLLGGDQPTKAKTKKRGKKTTAAAARQAPAPTPAAATRRDASTPPPSALGKPTPSAPTLTPAQEKAQHEAWRKREREMLEQERKMLEDLGDK